ncbi:MAG: LicD family protein [Lachnospiraceae bacterium]|nr:LicD family protein [Lachnospiraceae bacterium]
MLDFSEDFFVEEKVCGFTISKMMKRAWAAQIEVVVEIARVCDRLGIKYFADFGTLLGAVRHQGFIPWDDDLDICMLRSDYNRFLSEAPALFESWFELKSVYNDPTYDIVKARVINGRHMNFDRNFLERFHNCPYAVGVDIFVIDDVPNDKKELDDLVESLLFLLKVEASIPECEPYDDDVMELMKQIEDTYKVTIDYNNRLRHEVKKIYDILSARYLDVDAKKVGCMMGLCMKQGGFIYDKNDFEVLEMMPFENIFLPVPKCYKEILVSNYGEDYMTPINIGASHDYPFYKDQTQGLKEVMEREFKTVLTDEMMEQLIEMKIMGA